jgi:hypothetical protein
MAWSENILVHVACLLCMEKEGGSQIKYQGIRAGVVKGLGHIMYDTKCSLKDGMGPWAIQQLTFLIVSFFISTNNEYTNPKCGLWAIITCHMLGKSQMQQLKVKILALKSPCMHQEVECTVATWNGSHTSWKKKTSPITDTMQ